MRLALLLAAVLLLVQAAPATAATLFSTDDPDEPGITTLHIRSGSSARNEVTVTANRPTELGGRQPTYLVRDPGEAVMLKPSADCRRVSRHAARCANTDIVSLELGPGDDVGRMGENRHRKPSFFALATIGMDGGKGDDDLRSRYASMYGGRGDDRLRGVGRVNGGPGRDRVRGGRTRDILEGGEGNDVLHGGPQRDEL